MEATASHSNKKALSSVSGYNSSKYSSTVTTGTLKEVLPYRSSFMQKLVDKEESGMQKEYQELLGMITDGL
jgi:hypothetical protein